MTGWLTEFRAQGYSRFQVKLAGKSVVEDITTIRETLDLLEPHERVWFDPNRAWLVDDAIRVILAVRDLSPMIENPCETYEECRVDHDGARGSPGRSSRKWVSARHGHAVHGIDCRGHGHAIRADRGARFFRCPSSMKK